MAEKYNPFMADIPPLDPTETTSLFPLALRRSMMWDMVGHGMIKDPEGFGETPASPDVLDFEYRDLVLRTKLLDVFGQGLDMFCAIAAMAATNAVLSIEPKTFEFTEEEKEQFLEENTRISTLVTKSVLGHLMQKGQIHAGAQV